MDLKLLFQELDWNLFQTPRDIQERCHCKKNCDGIKFVDRVWKTVTGVGKLVKGLPVMVMMVENMAVMVTMMMLVVSRVWASWSRACLSDSPDGRRGRDAKCQILSDITNHCPHL